MASAETFLPPQRGFFPVSFEDEGVPLPRPRGTQKGCLRACFLSLAMCTLRASGALGCLWPLPGGWVLCRGSWLLTCIFLTSAPASGLRPACHLFPAVSPGLSAPWSRERVTPARLRVWCGFCQLGGLLKRSEEAVAGEELRRRWPGPGSVTLLLSYNTAFVPGFFHPSPYPGQVFCSETKEPKSWSAGLTGTVKSLAAPR